MWCSRKWLLLLAIPFLSAIQARATTWHVEQDGSGEFTVIQDAVDAAAPGDTIMIGPGQYTEHTVSGMWRYYVDINNKIDITLIGSGPEQTIIGPETYDDPELKSNVGIYGYEGIDNLNVQDIKFLNLNNRGILLSSYSYLLAKNCVFEYCDLGIFGRLSFGGIIEGCRFEDCETAGISIHAPSFGVVIKECEFTDIVFIAIGFHWSPISDCEVQSCTISGGAVGCQFDNGASGLVKGCNFNGQNINGLAISNGCTVVLENNWIEQGVPNDHVQTAAIGIYGVDMHIEGQGNVVISGRKCFYFYGSPSFNMQNNHFLRGDEEAWYVRVTEPFAPEHHVNLFGNYWGTDDQDEISAWIYDAHDSEDINLWVHFWPILEEPVVGVNSPQFVQANQIRVWPNPFNPQTNITYTLSQNGLVRLAVYDLLGRKVAVLIDDYRPAGPGSVTWDGRDASGSAVATGVYIARLETTTGVSTQKLVLAR